MKAYAFYLSLLCVLGWFALVTGRSEMEELPIWLFLGGLYSLVVCL